ncbi:MAG: lamin tail domain-containing protein [Candidatus Peribacteraceae bacterium]|nr:lamin tail domain-containing protein [Candidatus Peribacteraceae bacterium]
MVRYRAMRIFRFLFLFFLVCVALYARRASAAAVISEVLWMGSERSTADEWVELAGVGEAQDMSGWTLTALAGNGEEVAMVRFAEGTVIQAGGYMVISNFGAQESCLLNEPAIVTTAIALPNSKLLLRLYDASGALIDQADDGVGEPFAGINASGTGTRASMERIDLTLPGDQKENWAHAVVKLGLDEECAVLGTPGRGREVVEVVEVPEVEEVVEVPEVVEVEEENASSTSSTSSAVSVFITEILANPPGADDAEWVEIANLGAESVDIAGWVLKLESAGKGYKIPETQAGSGFLLAPGQHAVFRKTESGIALKNAGDTVLLLHGDTVMHALFYFETAENVSYGLDPYDPSHPMRLCLPTPGAANRLSSIDVSIGIQSHTGKSMEKGVISGVGKVSVNPEARSPHSLTGIACRWNFGDGETSDSCNPGAHVYDLRGAYGITMQAVDQCGSVSSDELAVFVEEKECKDCQENKESNEGEGETSSLPSSLSLQSFSSSHSSCVPSNFSGIAVSEFLPNPAGDDAAGEWIELVNQAEQEADLCGWSVDDAEGGSEPFSLDGLTIAPGRFLLLPRAQTKIALNNSDDAVRLFAPTASGSSLLQEVPYGKVKEGESYALTGSGAYAWTAEPTPGYANVLLLGNKEELKSTKSKTSVKSEGKTEQKNYTSSTVKSTGKQTVASNWLTTRYRNVLPQVEEVEEEIPESHRYLAQAILPGANTPLPVLPDAQKGGGEFVFVLIANAAGALFLIAKKGIIDK